MKNEMELTHGYSASDNGAHNEGFHKVTFFNSTGGLRGFKRSLYEGGVRSPTLMRWPKTIEAGRRSSLRWAFWDGWYFRMMSCKVLCTNRSHTGYSPLLQSSQPWPNSPASASRRYHLILTASLSLARSRAPHLLAPPLGGSSSLGQADTRLFAGTGRVSL